MQNPVKKVIKRPHNTTSHIITLHEDLNQPITHKGNLYLSGVSALNDAQDMKEKQIDCVLSIIDPWAYNHFKVQQKIAHLQIKTHKWINLQDQTSVEILPQFVPALDFIRQNLKNTNVLVHCQMGISRSASIVIAFVMKEMGISLNQAYKHVKARRSIIEPNSNFCKNLTQFQVQIKEQFQKLA